MLGDRLVSALVSNIVLTVLAWVLLLAARPLCESEAASAAWNACAVILGIFGPPFLLDLQLRGADAAHDTDN